MNEQGDGLQSIEPASTLPEGALLLPKITTLGVNNRELEKTISSGLNVKPGVIDLLRRRPTPEEPQTLGLAVLTTRAMGLEDYPTTTEIWEETEKFADRVSAEAMVRLAIAVAEGKIKIGIGKHLIGTMEPITDSHDYPRVLCVVRRSDGVSLQARLADPDFKWGRDNWFVVSPREN